MPAIYQARPERQKPHTNLNLTREVQIIQLPCIIEQFLNPRVSVLCVYLISVLSITQPGNQNRAAGLYYSVVLKNTQTRKYYAVTQFAFTTTAPWKITSLHTTPTQNKCRNIGSETPSALSWPPCQSRTWILKGIGHKTCAISMIK